MNECTGPCCKPPYPEVPVHPVQTRRVVHHSAKCPQVVTCKAYEVYCHVYAPQEALVTGNCRGGFGVGELIAFLYARSFPKEQWRQRVDEAMHGMTWQEVVELCRWAETPRLSRVWAQDARNVMAQFAAWGDSWRDDVPAAAAYVTTDQYKTSKRLIAEYDAALSVAGTEPPAPTVEDLQAVIERDRTNVCDAINGLKKVIREREWLGEGRGPYEWDDDRWHDEFNATAAEIREALKPLEKIAANLSNSPTTHEAVQKAREIPTDKTDDFEARQDAGRQGSERCPVCHGSEKVPLYTWPTNGCRGTFHWIDAAAPVSEKNVSGPSAFVSDVNIPDGPSCSACGVAMVKVGVCDGSICHQTYGIGTHPLGIVCGDWHPVEFRCPSCGATTGLTDAKGTEPLAPANPLVCDDCGHEGCDCGPFDAINRELANLRNWANRKEVELKAAQERIRELEARQKGPSAETSAAYAAHVRDAYRDGCECAMCVLVRELEARQSSAAPDLFEMASGEGLCSTHTGGPHRIERACRNWKPVMAAPVPSPIPAKEEGKKE